MILICKYCRVDCGIFVIKFIEERSENKEIKKVDDEFQEKAIGFRRAELSLQILSCKKYSWSYEVHLTQQFLLAEQNNPDNV